MSINFKTNSEQIYDLADEIGLDISDIRNPVHNLDSNAESADEFLYEILKHYIKKNRYEKIIRVVTQGVHRSIDLQTVLDNSIEAMVSNIDKMDTVSIYLVEGEDAVLKAHHGFTSDYRERAGRIPYPKGGTWKSIIDAAPRYVPDADKDNTMGQAGRDMGIKCFMTSPLFDEDKVVGTIIIVSYEKNVFNNEELELLEIVSRQISIAIRNANQVQALKDSEEALKKAQYELEERVQERTSELQKSNNLLIKEILERRYMEKELKQSLVEKNVLLKEIHHRVKNNLQIISSLLNLQSRQLKDKSVLGFFNESNNRIRSIATLHEQLYRSKDLSRINFSAYLRNMTNNLLRSYGVLDGLIAIKINSKHILLDINTAIPCGLIVNELVSNAIKHGFPDGRSGEITIEFNLYEGTYVLIVSNNGACFPKDLDIDNCTTLGLELVSSLSKQLKGTLSLQREKTVEFRLEFKA